MAKKMATVTSESVAPADTHKQRDVKVDEESESESESEDEEEEFDEHGKVLGSRRWLWGGILVGAAAAVSVAALVVMGKKRR